VWAVDFQFDETVGGKPIKILNVTDEYTREALACVVARNLGADRTAAVLEGLVEQRGAPQHLRSANGPELVSWTLRDWCRYTNIQSSYIEPGAPWKNPYVESFNGHLRDELLNLEVCSTHSSKLASLSRTGGANTTTTDPTHPSTTRPQQPSPDNGIINTTKTPHYPGRSTGS